jgi:cytochrome c-type biogenesis protein CcmH/NrfG
MSNKGQEACLKLLSAWIVQYKRKAWENHVKTNDDSNELQLYKNNLEELERDLRKAIYMEDTHALQSLGWPEELVECIKDMSVRPDISDLIYESLVTHHFNRSPKHEEELEREKAGLR